MVVPGKISTQGYTQVFCLCYGYKWMTFPGVVVKDRLFFRVILIMLHLSW